LELWIRSVKSITRHLWQLAHDLPARSPYLADSRHRTIAVTDGEVKRMFLCQSLRYNGRVLLREMRARCGVDGGCFYITMSNWDPSNSV
jgi:hypothetical protein